MTKPFCQNPDCRLYGWNEVEGRGIRVHNEDTGSKIESREYFGLRFCTRCCPDEQTANAIIENYF